MKTAYLFPGQGSQAVGMGRALQEAFPIVKEVFQEVDEALKQNLSRLMMSGPEFDLGLTANTQPAIMACSAAVLAVLKHEVGVDVTKAGAFVAGHSLGEYSALVAAESLSVSQAATLLRTRGTAMQKAVPVGEGSMAAIIGLSIEQVEAVCNEQDGVCEVANHNSDQQIVISGSKEAIESAMEKAKEAGAKRAVALPVSAPFHCSLMQPAADTMQDALADAEMKDAALPLIANVTAQPVQDATTIKELLVKQVTGRVRWKETVDYLNAEGVEHYVEVGHGKVLTGLLKRMAPDAKLSQLGTPDDFEALSKAA